MDDQPINGQATEPGIMIEEPDAAGTVIETENELKVPDLAQFKLDRALSWESHFVEALESMDVKQIHSCIYRKMEAEAVLDPLLKRILYRLWKRDFRSVNGCLEIEMQIPSMEEEQQAELVFLLLSHHCPPETFLVLSEKGINFQLPYHHLSPLIYSALTGRPDILQICYQQLPESCKLKMKEQDTSSQNNAFPENSQEDRDGFSTGTKFARRTALMYAARSQSVESVLYLLNQGFVVNTADDNGLTPLMCAAYCNREDCIKLLLEGGADVHYKTKLGVTALMIAAQVGVFSTVSILIEYGADVNDADLCGTTVLINAVKGGCDKCVKTILEHGADVNQVDSSGLSALMEATLSPNLKCMKLLLGRFADIRQRNQDGMSSFLMSAVEGNFEALQLLLESGADINETSDPEELTALHIAARHGFVNCVRFLLRSGANRLCSDKHGNTAQDMANVFGNYQCAFAISEESIDSGMIKFSRTDLVVNRVSDLMIMSHGGWSSSVETLISRGVDVNCVDEQGRDAVCYAIRGDAIDCLAVLLKHGASVLTRDNDDFSALMIAAALNHSHCLGLLLGQECDMNAVDKFGMTAAMVAASRGSLHTLKRLIYHDPRQISQNSSGFSMLMYAVGGGHLDCAEFLLKKGCSVTDCDKTGKTVFMYAVQGQNKDLMSLLLEYGCSVEEVSYDNTTALMLASFKGCVEGVEFLLMHGAKVDSLNEDGLTALIYSILGKSVQCTSLLIKAGADINIIENTGNNAIKFAAQLGLKETVKMLLDHPEGVRLVHEDDSSAAMNALAGDSAVCLSLVLDKMASNGDKFDLSLTLCAARKGNLECLIEFLKYPEYNLNEVDDTGMSVLMNAAAGGSLECVKLLCDRGAELEHRDQLGKTAILCACQNGCFEVVEHLLKVGAQIEVIDNTGASALMYAAGSGKDRCVALVLQHIADVNVIDNSGFNALIYAIIGKNSTSFEALLKSGIDKSNKDPEGMSTFLYTAHKGILNFLECFVEDGYDLEETNIFQQTALMMAVAEGWDDCVMYLLEKGANIHAEDDHRKTAIFYAAESGRDKSLLLLLNAGSKVNHQDSSGKTALVCAVQEEMLLSTMILLHKGAEADLADDAMMSALMRACRVSERPEDFLELLLSYGASINLRDGEGNTALIHAVLNEKKKCVKVLIDHSAEVSLVNTTGDSVVTLALSHKDPACLELVMDTQYVQNEPKEQMEFLVQRNFVMASQRCLRILISKGFFRWEWLNGLYLVPSQLQTFTKVVVTTNMQPGEFKMRGKPTTLFQIALREKHLGAVKYILANRYLAALDLRYLSGHVDLVSELKEAVKINNELRNLLPHIIATPWSLQALSLLTVSNCMAAASSPCPFGRADQVRHLPIPEFMKQILNFESRDISMLCPEEWDKIELRLDRKGRPEKDLLSIRQFVWLHPEVDFSCCSNCLLDQSVKKFHDEEERDV